MNGDMLFAPPGEEARGPRRPSWSAFFNVTKNDTGGFTVNVLPSHGERRAVIVGSELEAFELMAILLKQGGAQLEMHTRRGRVPILK